MNTYNSSFGAPRPEYNEKQKNYFRAVGAGVFAVAVLVNVLLLLIYNMPFILMQNRDFYDY